MQKDLTNPLFVYAKDLFKIFPHLTTEQGVYSRYNKIKKDIGKKKHQYITVKELSYYLDVEIIDLLAVIQK